MNFLIVILLIPVATGVPFLECLEVVRSGRFGTVGGFDNRGNPVSDISTATAISYGLCKRACGAPPQPVEPSIFLPQFSAWLLPPLALVSVLPFGANNFVANLMSVFLAVGSPALVAYSLALTVLNRRWIKRRFILYGYETTDSAVHFLNSLQQSPVRLRAGKFLGHILHPRQRQRHVRWWNYWERRLVRTHTWTIPAVASIFWVLLAYILTVVGSFKIELGTTRDSHGQSIGSLWIWLIAIITSWLLISPKDDPTRLQDNVRKAQERGIPTSYVPTTVVTRPEVRVAAGGPDMYAIGFWLPARPNWRDHDVDEWCTAPIYNYARCLNWVRDMEEVCWRYHDAPGWVRPQGNAPRRMLDGPWRFLVASLLAILLQWGTTGAAMFVNYFTPTIGLGCHSGGTLGYGVTGTGVWILLVWSSWLSHKATRSGANSDDAIVLWSKSLRRIGKVFAILNSIWALVLCVAQLSNFFDRCGCEGGIIQRGDDAVVVIQLLQDDLAGMKRGWEVGVSLAVGSASLYVCFMIFFIHFPNIPKVKPYPPSDGWEMEVLQAAADTG